MRCRIQLDNILKYMKNILSNHQSRKYDIVQYNADWKEIFLNEAKKLAVIFGEKALIIEHVGSTSVIGMLGKSTIDILILVDDINGIQNIAEEEMRKLGYVYLGEYVKPGALLFAKEKDDARLINVHVMPKNHPEAKNMLDFRDYLRSHPEDIVEYSRLKLELFEKYPNDYTSYRKFKDEYLKTLKKKMRS